MLLFNLVQKILGEKKDEIQHDVGIDLISTSMTEMTKTKVSITITLCTPAMIYHQHSPHHHHALNSHLPSSPSQEVIPDLQTAASTILTTLGTRYPREIVEELMKRFEPGQPPHYFVMKTLADLATANCMSSAVSWQCGVAMWQ